MQKSTQNKGNKVNVLYQLLLRAGIDAHSAHDLQTHRYLEEPKLLANITFEKLLKIGIPAASAEKIILFAKRMFVVHHKKGSKSDPITELANLSLAETNHEFEVWSNAHFWHMFDPNWFLEQNWENVSIEKLLTLRIALGRRPFLKIVCQHIAKNRPSSEKKTILNFEKTDGEFINSLKFPAEVVTDLFEKLEKMKTWRNKYFKLCVGKVKLISMLRTVKEPPPNPGGIHLEGDIGDDAIIVQGDGNQINNRKQAQEFEL